MILRIALILPRPRSLPREPALPHIEWATLNGPYRTGQFVPDGSRGGVQAPQNNIVSITEK